MNQTKTIIIGGFALNQLPLTRLINTLNNYYFVDINALPAPFTLEELAQQIIVQFGQQDSSLKIVAYSCGGLLALKVAELMPKQVKLVILINSTPCFMQQDNWQGITYNNLQLLQQRLENFSLQNFLNYFTQLTAQPVTLSRSELNYWQSKYCHQANLDQWLKIIANADLRTLIPNLTPQLIWFNAAHDQLIPFPQQNPNTQILSASSHLELNSQQLISQIKLYL